ncbi:MAG: dTDP-4-amino-4,6-dideoxygalactose transaminase [Coriobacteriales bacterium]|nr:dTDP-4-amino-4,6-dideoxygalactose transaminase [Coriobacteriales bacterium]
MIPFNKAPYTGYEAEHVAAAVATGKLSGDGEYTKRCHAWLEEQTGAPKALLTTSCTHALEMSAILSNITLGDEVIMPSYTFVSTADAFVSRGATAVFVDIRPDTMNINESLIEAAITKRTRAICVVHYAGVSCEMDVILDIAKRHNLIVVEDAAQAVLSFYKGRPLGTLGEFGCYSFHDTKNLTMGEGGALLINKKDYVEKAEIVREKGTDRSKFFRGEVDKYSWVEVGSSYLPSELNAAYLWPQLERATEITAARMACWDTYYKLLEPLANPAVANNGHQDNCSETPCKVHPCIELPSIPSGCEHNAHMFYIKCADVNERASLITYLKENDIYTVFHYVPLHSAPAGIRHGRFNGEDVYTTKESERLLRLPMYYGLKTSEAEYIANKVISFYGARGFCSNGGVK